MTEFRFLPKEENCGKRGYYPVTNKQEWEELPDIYKVMEWKPVKDHHGKLSYVKTVIFDVTYLKPYKISAKVEVHRQEIQKILFCSFNNPQCLLYSVCGVILANGSRLPAKWYQDNTTGSFAIYACNTYAGVQGGFCKYIPKSCKQAEDGSYKYCYNNIDGIISHYAFNPFD